MDRSKTLYPPQLVAWDIKSINISRYQLLINILVGHDDVQFLETLRTPSGFHDFPKEFIYCVNISRNDTFHSETVDTTN